MEREIQQNIKDTHNLVVQNILHNEQVKFICFCKIDYQKSLFKNGVQNKFITALVIGGRNFVKLFAIFQNSIAFELGSYKIHEDITNILEWGKTIMIETKHKVIGLIYQQQMLKNAFMVSLQFLPLNSSDSCSCITDKKGFFFAIQIKNYLLICLSNLILSSYQSKPFYKPNCQIITEDVKWNCQEDKPYVEQIIKIKLSDLEICFIYDISICVQSIYYTIYKKFQKQNVSSQFGVHHLYRIPVQLFFQQKSVQPVFQFLTKKDTDVKHVYPYCFQKQIEYLYCKKDSIFIQNKNGMKMIQQFEKNENYEILQKDQTQIFPLWIKVKGKINVYLRRGFQIIQYQILNDLYFQKMIIRHYKTIIYSTMTETCIIDIKNYQKFLLQSCQFLKAKCIIHRSIGNIIDFAIIKNSIYLVQCTDRHSCKFYELKRQLSIDPKTYVLHSKKNKLQQIILKSQPVIHQLKSFVLPSDSITQNYDNYIAATTNLNFQIYKETQNGFQIKFQGLIYYATAKLKDIIYFLTVNQNKELFVTNFRFNQEMIDESQKNKNRQLKIQLFGDFTYHTQKWLVQDIFIYFLTLNQILFLNIVTTEQFRLTFQFKQDKIVKFCFNKKHYTLSQNQNEIQILQFTVVYQTLLQIHEINIKTKSCTSIQLTQNIYQGLPILINHQLTKQTLEKNRFRSITCPQYILSQYPIETKHLKIVNALHYCYQEKELLILINSQKQIMVYKKFLCFSDKTDYIYKRILLPLSIIKNFKWNSSQNEKQICYLGEGVWKIGTIVLFKGEFLQYQANSKCYFQMDKMLWTLHTSENKQGKQIKLRMIDVKRLRGEQETQVLFKPISAKLQSLLSVFSNFVITPIRSLMKKQIVGLQSTNQYFVLYSKSGFQIINQKDFKLVWVQQAEGIIKLKAFGNLLGMSYFDEYQAEDSQYKSIKFKFRIYNILSKTKIIQKEKTTDQPILHIKSLGNDKIILATSMTLFLCYIKNQKSLEILKTKNFSRRAFMNCFSYIQELVSISKPGYMLFGNRYGGLSFHAGKWAEQDNLRQFWYEEIKCHIRQISLFHYGIQLKALVADEDCNLIVLNLKSDSLQKIADINVGSKVNSLKFKGEHDKVVYGCFQDGTIKTILAVQLDNIDVSYLDFQEEAFCKQLPFLGGFNSRVSRLLNQQYRTYKIVAKGNVVDGQILQQFFGLTSSLKQYICQKSQIDIQKIKSLLKSI